MEINLNQQKYLADLELFVNNSNNDQALALKSVVKLMFCVIQQYSQFPFLFSNMKKEVEMLKKQHATDIERLHLRLQQNDKEIEELKQQIKDIETYQSTTIVEKPNDFEENIFEACKVGKLSSVKWLIEKEKIDKNIKNTYDNTLIHIASEHGHLPVVKYLIEKQNIDVDTKGEYERTPLHYACWEGHLPVAEYLITKGANVEAKEIDPSKITSLSAIGNGCHGNYVIHFASMGGVLPIVKYIIEKYNTDINICNELQRTPLHYACEYGHFGVVEYLISNGANIDATENWGFWTPLHFAAWSHYVDKDHSYISTDGFPEIVKYLVSKGANKNPKDKSNRTPYYLACNDEIRCILQ